MIHRTLTKSLVLTAVLSAPALVLAQDPTYADLPGGAADKDLVSLVRVLSRQVQDLESRLNALEVKNVPAHSAALSKLMADRSDALEKVVADAKVLKTKLDAALDGYHFSDPGNARVIYWKIKNNGDWPTVQDNIKRFVSFMDAVLPRAGELSPDSTTAYSDLIRWGRGRILYRTGFGMAQQEVLALDYGVAVVPLPPDPAH